MTIPATTKLDEEKGEAREQPKDQVTFRPATAKRCRRLLLPGVRFAESSKPASMEFSFNSRSSNAKKRT